MARKTQPTHARKSTPRPKGKRRAKASVPPAPSHKRAPRTMPPSPPPAPMPPSPAPAAFPSANADHGETQWTPAVGEVGIRVRMYRVGFGDFFLVTCLNQGASVHIIVDCGVFKGTSQTGDIGSIEAAVAD